MSYAKFRAGPKERDDPLTKESHGYSEKGILEECLSLEAGKERVRQLYQDQRNRPRSSQGENESGLKESASVAAGKEWERGYQRPLKPLTRWGQREEGIVEPCKETAQIGSRRALYNRETRRFVMVAGDQESGWSRRGTGLLTILSKGVKENKETSLTRHKEIPQLRAALKSAQISNDSGNSSYGLLYSNLRKTRRGQPAMWEVHLRTSQNKP